MQNLRILRNLEIHEFLRILKLPMNFIFRSFFNRSFNETMVKNRCETEQQIQFNLLLCQFRVISQTALPIDLFVFLTTPEELSTTITIFNTFSRFFLNSNNCEF